MKLAQVLDVVEGLLRASEHPDIVGIERYGDGAGPWGPDAATSKVKTVSGIRVRHQATSTASAWGAIWKSDPTPLPVPEAMPNPGRRASRLAIFIVQLLDVARPSEFRSWQLAALPGLAPAGEEGVFPVAISLECTDGTTMLLRTSATGAMVGADPEEEAFPDYVIPEGVKSWRSQSTAPSATSA
jgi:hypothetical protein